MSRLIKRVSFPTVSRFLSRSAIRVPLMIFTAVSLFFLRADYNSAQDVSIESKVQAIWGSTGFARRAGNNYQVGCATTDGHKVVASSSKTSFDDAILISGVKPVQPKFGEIVVFVCNEAISEMRVQPGPDSLCYIHVTANPGNAPIQSIVLSMDGQQIATRNDGFFQLNYTLNLRTVSDGPHGLGATALDTAGLQGNGVLVFMVNKARARQRTCE